MSQEELFDVVNPETLEKLFVKKRKEVHRDGDWHRSAHMWIINKQGELVLQKRTPTKDSYPNMWDISSAGHLSAGDSSLEGAVRELDEELGLKVQPSELRFLFTNRKSVVLNGGKFLDNECQDVYIIERDGLDLKSLVLQESEVSDVKWMHWKDLLEAHRRKDPTLVPLTLDMGGYGPFFQYLARHY